MNKIYLDNNSTTQIDPLVLESMLPYFSEKYGNSSSQSHAFGWEARAAIDIAREQVANILNAEEEEIIFTSGATESNNLALLGYINSLSSNKSEIITSSIEHKAILDVCIKINKNGNNIFYVKPNEEGIIDFEKVKNQINQNIKIISIMHANNEIGTIQPIKELGKLCKDNNIIFHVDAAQSLGKIKIDVKDMNIDLLSISSHKIYGPKGVGALYIKNKIKIDPLIVGGGQENNIRSGTLATPLIVGFGKACEISLKKIDSENKKIKKLSNNLIDGILNKYPDSKLN